MIRNAKVSANTAFSFVRIVRLFRSGSRYDTLACASLTHTVALTAPAQGKVWAEAAEPVAWAPGLADRPSPKRAAPNHRQGGIGGQNLWSFVRLDRGLIALTFPQNQNFFEKSAKDRLSQHPVAEQCLAR
jgi:hypothetical protein